MFPIKERYHISIIVYKHLTKKKIKKNKPQQQKKNILPLGLYKPKKIILS